MITGGTFERRNMAARNAYARTRTHHTASHAHKAYHMSTMYVPTSYTVHLLPPILHLTTPHPLGRTPHALIASPVAPDYHRVEEEGGGGMDAPPPSPPAPLC